MGKPIAAVESYENEDRSRIAQATLNPTALPPMHVSEREDEQTILKTQAVGPSAIHSTATPSFTDASLVGRVNPEIPADDSDDELALQAVLDFPPLAWEAIQAGLKKEKITDDQLNGYIKTAEGHQKNIDLLLDFSAELSSSENAGQLTEKMKAQLAELKERGVDLWKGDSQMLTKERLSELKSLTSSRIEKERSNVQSLFMINIQPLVTNTGAIIETLKDITRNNGRLMSTITGNQRVR